VTGHRETLSSSTAFDAGFFEVVCEKVRLPDGSEHDYVFCKHPGAVAVVPVDENGRVLMVRQFRQAVDDALLEIPAGKIDPGEDPWACAHRELKEETGYECGDLELVSTFYASPGMTDEKLHVFVGRELKVVAPAPTHDGGEPIAMEWMEKDEAFDAIRDGRIVDGKSIVGITLYEHAARHEMDHH
jgi:ADP-ribose pyrophosphatase